METTDTGDGGASLGWWEYDPRSDRIGADDRARAIVGCPHGGRATLNDVAAAIHADDRPSWTRSVEAVMAPDGPPSFEVVARVVGSDRPGSVRIAGRVERDGAGEPRRIAGFVEDAAPASLVDGRDGEGGDPIREALRRDRELLTRLIDRIPVMVAVYDPSVREVHLNPHVERVTGWTDEDARRHDIMELCYPDPSYRAEVRDFMTSLSSGWREIEMVRKDGTRVATSWANIRLSDERRVGIGIDITDRKRVERMLRDRERAAEARARRAEGERALLERVAQHSPAVIAIYSGPDHVVTMKNAAWDRILERPDALGRPFLEVFPELEDTEIPRMLDRVYETGVAVVAQEEPLPLRRDGRTEISYWDFLLVPLEDRDGPTENLLVHAVEVTGHVETRSRLEELRVELERDFAQLEAVVDRMDDGLVVADMEGELVRWNPRALELHGLESRESGSRTLEAFSEDFSLRRPNGTPLPVEEWPLARALRGESFTGWDVVVERVEDGEARVFRYGGAPVMSGGEQILALVTVRDVTEEVERRRQLEEAKQAAETANRAKSDFLASMSHDLRTPLNAIAGYADLLDAEVFGPLDPRQREAIERIRVSQGVLLRLINDVLNFVKIDAEGLEIRSEAMDAGALSRELEGLARGLAGGHDVTLLFEECPAGLEMRGDPDRVRQILLNLLSNAIKHTPSGGRISVRCEADGGRVRFHVADTGPGIPAEDRERIFDPFVQLGDDVDDPASGVGLGLSIGRDLARAMGGELSLESEVGKGSRFTLELPVAR